jgi:(E)-4-hydroxy-3-methylbut-2-enyl-diphosphate synthase
VNAIPIQLYITGTGLGEEGVLEAARYAAENSVSAVWIDVFDRSAVDLCKTVASGTSLSVIASVHDPSLVGDALDAGVSGIAVHPSLGPVLISHREAVLKNRTDIFLLTDDRTLDSNTGYRDSANNGDATADLYSVVNEVAGTAGMLKDEGFNSVFVHIHHPNPALLFTVNRLVKDRLGTKHVVSMTRDGTREQSLIQNSLSLGSMFHEGIGDVLLITHDSNAGHGIGEGVDASIDGDTGESKRRRGLESLQESILFAVKILGSCKLFPKGYTIISCPTCGRCRLDLLHITREIDNQMKTLEEQFNREGKKLEDIGGISVAVMGCNVNGPGEARNADIGIAGRNNKTGVLFKNGKPFKSLPEKMLVSELIKHTRAIIEHKFETVVAK